MIAERYQLLPALRAEEYQALKADIAKRGVLVPVEVDEDGNILDGHNRSAIAAELGLSYDTIIRHFDGEQDKQEHVLKINLLRRHFGPIGWAEAFKRLCEVRGVAVGQGARNDKTSDTVSEVAKEHGVNERTARRRLALAADLADVPDLAAKVDSGEMEAKRALRVKREREAVAKADATEVLGIVLPKTIDLRPGDFREMLRDLPDASVDLIFTDPPYPKEYLYLWSAMAELAARVLKPGGLVVAYSGQYHLPAVMHSMAEHLEYVWLGMLQTPGPANQVQQKHIRSTVKPLLFYAKAPYVPGPWFEDSYIGEGRVKELHPWQQAIGAAENYIKRLTSPCAIVLDPFLGSGTTGLACKRTERGFIGCEIDPSTYAKAQERIANDKSGT